MSEAIRNSFNYSVFRIDNPLEVYNNLKNLLYLNNDYIIQIYDIWIEKNEILYIQMELCSNNFEEIIQQKEQFFGREMSEPMEPIEFLISCQILKELLEIIQYLLESKMKFNIRYENILILEEHTNGSFLKIFSYDLSKSEQNSKGETQQNYLGFGSIAKKILNMGSDG